MEVNPVTPSEVRDLPKKILGVGLGEPGGGLANTREGQMERRSHILESAGYWFKASRYAQDSGQNAEAIMCMENAYNHVENALAAARDFIEAYFVKGVLRLPDGLTYREHAKKILSLTGGSSDASGVSSQTPSLSVLAVPDVKEEEKTLEEPGDTEANTVQGPMALKCDICEARATRRNSTFLYCDEDAPKDHDVIVKRGPWDIGIFFPDCTFLTVSANRWANEEWRMEARHWALAFVKTLWALPIASIGIENPKGVLPSMWRRPTQIIQPWQFGHGELKGTCLWLKNLPALLPTDVVEGREPRVHHASPGPQRKINRARTYEGIARAMAEQWGGNALEVAA